ncbi:hypothetical protein DPEC_G00044120 [Dallia pectoralis]|uniref:Uncharacterized protein n=1 Tax=Dallia pectoralis TaxID=75939 RepID=A0ACC2HA95_DALPE|nr:hypothetical protein DPEC_G00044120 [Dallia pectoralis]
MSDQGVVATSSAQAAGGSLVQNAFGDIDLSSIPSHEQGKVIRESSSPYASLVVLVKKKDGSIRLCVDYRQLNGKTRKDAFPLPHIEESLDALSGTRWFSTMDLASGYNQVPVAEADRNKTAFYEHVKRLEAVLSRLHQEGLKVKLEKCSFFQPEVKYLGHVISKDGVSTDPDKISAVANWAPPNHTSELRSFLGFASYYRARLVAAPVLNYADFSLPFILEVDASYSGLGAVLSQEQSGKVSPVAYASRGLKPTERNMTNYSYLKLEFLALKWAMTEKFREYLLGQKCVVYTDNNPLSYLSTAKLGALEQRWAAQLSDFDFTIKYRPGRSMVMQMDYPGSINRIRLLRDVVP